MVEISSHWRTCMCGVRSYFRTTKNRVMFHSFPHKNYECNCFIWCIINDYSCTLDIVRNKSTKYQKSSPFLSKKRPVCLHLIHLLIFMGRNIFMGSTCDGLSRILKCRGDFQWCCFSTYTSCHDNRLDSTHIILIECVVFFVYQLHSSHIL